MRVSLDFELALAISGWIIGVVSLYIAIKERRERKQSEKTVQDLKKSEFSETIAKAVSSIFPSFPEFKWKDAARAVSAKHLLGYLRAVSSDDPNVLLDTWAKVAVSLGDLAQNNTGLDVSSPKGLAECVCFMTLSHFSRTRGREYINSLERSDEKGLEGLTRYYLAFNASPNSLSELVNSASAASEEQIRFALSSLRGQEFERVLELFEDQKWSRRMIGRMREILHIRQISYPTLATTVLEANPLPRLFIVFKNEGVEETEDEVGKGRVVQSILHKLRAENKVELIAPLAPVYFVRNKETINEFLSALPEGESSNYLVFTAAVDPLTVNIKTSDKLEGKPAMLYENLVRFRSEREVYESILLRLGLHPGEIIETADLGFLVEPKTEPLTTALRSNSARILRAVSDFSKKNLGLLTNLRNLDDDDIGFFGSRLAEASGLSESEGRRLAEQIVKEATELFRALYEQSP